MLRFFIILIFSLSSLNAFCEKCELVVLDSAGTILSNGCIEISTESFTEKRPNPILRLFKKNHRRNKRITAAVLAFPFPFGIVGLHRIYLGTKPFVPVAYIASLGGGLGVLPFIDFCVLILDKDIEYYTNNGKVFMWIK